MTTEPNPVDYYIHGYVNISRPKLRSEKFDDDDDDDNNCNWAVTWWQWLFYMYTKYTK